MKKKYNFSLENKFYYSVNQKRFDKILNHYELLKLSKKVKGDIVELGVFKGVSIIRLALFRDILKIKKKIYGFDTFSKFPKNNSNYLDDRKFPKNFEKIAGKPVKIEILNKLLKNKNLKNIKLIKGNIFNTLKLFTKDKKISFLHLDLDTEDVTFFAIKTLYPNLTKGGIIVFDDYNIHKGINRAFKKYFKNKINIEKPIYGNNPFYIIKN